MPDRTRSKTPLPLWTCPKCGLKLIRRNLAHSCGRATLAAWQARMGPCARALYDHFEQLIAACGEYHVAPAKPRIALMASCDSQAITRLDETVMHGSFALPTRLGSPRFHKIHEIVPGGWVHELRVTTPIQLDDQVQRWIRRSYRLMGMRERLQPPHAAAPRGAAK